MQGDLEAPIIMARCLEVYHGGDRTKASGKGPGKFEKQNQRNGMTAQVEESSSRGVVQMVQYSAGRTELQGLCSYIGQNRMVALGIAE